MPYDLFISYSRKDNQNHRITELKDRIAADYLGFSGEELRCFFDLDDIQASPYRLTPKLQPERTTR